MINNTIKQAYIKRKVFKTLSEKSHDRKFEFVDRLREPVVMTPSKLPDLDLNLNQKGIRVSNNPIPGYSISPEEFKLLEVPENTTVLFERGQIYNFGEKDFSNANIVVKGYGAGVDAIIRGSSDISTLSWTDEGGGIWSTPMAEEPNWIWIDGECAKLAETTRVAIASRGSTTTITVNAGALSAYSNVVGSYIVAKKNIFSLSARRTVTNFASEVLTFDGTIPTANNVDFALYNKFEFFVGDNEWAWESGELRIKAAASPSTMDIRVSSFDYCFKDSANTEFSDLEFKEYYQFGIWSNNGVSSVSGCSFHDIRDIAIFVERAVTGLSVTDCTLSRIGNNGILMRPCTNAAVTGCTISDIGMQSNYGWQTWASVADVTQSNGVGILYATDVDNDTVDGSNNSFNENVISNTAYNGISMQGTDNFILRNVVHNFMNRFADGGGIYTFHYREYDIPQANTEIANNIVYNGNDPENDDLTIGIYLDNRTLAAYVHDNTVYDIDGYGILANGDTKNHTIQNNNILNCTIAQVWYNDGFAGVDPIYLTMDGVTFTGNVMYCGNSTQRCMRITSNEGAGYTPYSNGGSADNNYYISRFNNQIVNNNIAANRTLAQLQSDYSQDAASVYRENYAGLITNETSSVVNSSIDEHALSLVAASTQQINFGTHPDIHFEYTEAVAISFRFKVVSAPAVSQVMISCLGASNRGFTINMLNTGLLQMELRNTVSTNRYTITTSASLADNKWHHVLILKPATHANSSMVVDGVTASVSEVDNLSATIVTTNNLIIGNRESTSQYFDGVIKNIAYWNSDQSANVSVIFNGGLLQNYLNLVSKPIHYWRIQDGASDAIKFEDTGTSANKLNGTGQNDPVITQPTYDVDLNALTNYSLIGHSGLVYLVN